MEIIKFNGQDITSQFKSGRWSHPVTGVKYPSNFPVSEIDGVTIENIPDPTPETPTLEQQFEAVRVALQSAIDVKAQEFEFSNGNSLMLYAGFVNPFQSLAQQFATWEASVWVEAGQYKAQVIAGTQPMLTPEQAVAMMPAYA